MKRSSFIIGILFCLILISNVAAVDFKQCQKDCIKNVQINTKSCNYNFQNCNDLALNYLKNCSFLYGKNKTNCLIDGRYEISKCVSHKKDCLKDIDNNVARCKKKCSYEGKNVTCENGKYSAGDLFLNGCEKCECNGNGKVSCKTSEYCNFNELVNKKEECNGLFQKLCAGSIMSTKCTQEVYCQCGGNLNLSCGNESICLYDFSLNDKRGFQFSQGWVEFPNYKKLGNIGICVKKPIMYSCGNGICENKCIDGNCSLAETSYNCGDCK